MPQPRNETRAHGHEPTVLTEDGAPARNRRRGPAAAVPPAGNGNAVVRDVAATGNGHPPTAQVAVSGNEHAVAQVDTAVAGNAGATFPVASRRARRSWFGTTLCVVVELVALAGGMVLAAASQTSFDWQAMAAFAALTLLVGGSRRNGIHALSPRYLAKARSAVGASAFAAMGVLAAQTLIGPVAPASEAVASAWLGCAVLLLLGYALIAYLHRTALRRGTASRPTLIIGAGIIGHRVARRLLQSPQFGLAPVGFLDSNPLDVGILRSELPVLGAEEDLEKAIAKTDAKHVIVTFSNTSHAQLLALVRRCWALRVSVSLVPRLFEIQGEEAKVAHLGNLPLVSVSPVAPDSRARLAKYALERGIALLLLVGLAPLLALVALAVRVGVGSPILYRQLRVGRNGDIFQMIKFRTMRTDDAGEAEADADWAAEVLELPVEARPLVFDRTTRVGRFLRRHSLDELPQLWNVIRGNMALVGPRPERVTYVTTFQDAVYRYGDRHRVKPGLTGWAQVNGLRGRTSLADRVEWDNYYIENWSPLLDLKILVLTFPALVNRKDRPETRRGGILRRNGRAARTTKVP
jgi:exopolysaccharide biosynthesis polyprenyl glycosylphosphotransferase